MAKRRRKMTLFDVMHTGQSVGLQVRTRTPAYHAAPVLPVTKKLAKLFGRTPRKAEAAAPRSAADELAQLRRELATKNPASEPIAEERPSVEAAREASEASRAVAPSRVEESIADSFAHEPHEPAAPREPAVPRKPLGDILREQWEVISPKLGALAAKLRTFGGQGARHAAFGLSGARELYNRYAVTTAAAVGVVVLLCGSFYAGKLLFNRPANSLQSVATNDVRPEVLDINSKDDSRTSDRANEPIANINSQPETKLERQTDPPTKPGVFGGRRTDLNYVIIQSYPTQPEAIATVDVLAKYGVKSTVEMNLPKWAASGTTLYSVVGIEGYPKLTGNTAYEAYLAKIAQISDKEKGLTLAKKLSPCPYRWPANP